MFLYKRPQMKNKRRIGWIWWLGWYEKKKDPHTKKRKRHSESLQSFFGLSFPVMDRQDAKSLLAELQRKEIDKRLGIEQPDSIPVDQFYLEYFRFCDRNKTYNTVRADKYRFAKWLSFLKQRHVTSISQIDKRLLNDFIQTELRDKKNTTINLYVSVIRASLQWGVKQEYLKENPLKDMPKLSVKRPMRSVSFKEGDLEKLFSIEDKAFAVYLKLIYYTLMRRSEALNLTWDDVDMKREVIFIRQTKTKTPRMVPISDKLLDALKSLPKRSKKLFPDWKEHSITQKFRRLRKKLNLQIEGIHHFRHLCASELLRRGANPRDVQTLLGHKTVKTTMEIYAHTSMEGLKETVSKL